MQTKNLINGSWTGGGGLAVMDPATDEQIAEVPCSGAEETERAIAAAAEALPSWRSRTAAERGAILRRLGDLMLSQRDQLARLITREQGKPLAESEGEIAYAASFIEWAAEEGRRLYGETIPAASRDKRILVLRQPVGVTAAITPWNFPAAMITRKLGPALAAGCTMIVKPAEQTPLTALAIGELAQEAGVPPGVLNIVTGEPSAIGQTLLASPVVRKLSFTGSTEVGRIIMRGAAQNITRLSLELGGHAPFIVFDDADLDDAVAGAMANKFRNMGQTCICANRFLVQSGVSEAFVAKLAEAASQMKLGRGSHEGVEVGPLIDDSAVDKVRRHVADARDRGGHVRTGGDLVRVDGLANRFYAPTVIENCSTEMLLNREETFGPIAAVFPFADEAQAIVAANDSSFGLAAYFYTRDASRLMRVAEALEYGIVGANDGAPSVAQAPFGGMKQSGFGREGGKYVMNEYVDIKYVSWKL